MKEDVLAKKPLNCIDGSVITAKKPSSLDDGRLLFMTVPTGRLRAVLEPERPVLLE
jgi:hypothetical protein